MEVPVCRYIKISPGMCEHGEKGFQLSDVEKDHLLMVVESQETFRESPGKPSFPAYWGGVSVPVSSDG